MSLLSLSVQLLQSAPPVVEEKTNYWLYIIAIILQTGVIVYILRRNREQKKLLKDIATTPAADDSYSGLRALALAVSPADLKLNIPPTQTFIYGVVMDWNIGDVVVTLAAYINGAANMYLTTNEKITGGGKNPKVGNLAIGFVTGAAEYLGRAIPVGTDDLPLKECVRFYFLTNKGKYAAQEQVIYMEDKSSAWFPLFEKGNEVICEMRDNAETVKI